MPPNLPLRFVLVLTGLGVFVIGANVGLGGMQTMGLQVAPGFLEPVDQAVFDVQDNHVRFLGGFFAAAGLMFVAGAIWLNALRSSLVTLCALIALAGLFRFSQGLPAVANSDVLPSLGLELVFFPLLAFWLTRALPDQTQGT